MADVVQYKMERMVNELDDLEKCGIFTGGEIAEIVKKRRKFEFRLKRPCPLKHDFLAYIDYEKQVNDLRFLRRKALNRQLEKSGNKKLKTKVSDYAGVSRIIDIYRLATNKFKGDLRLWFQFLDFCVSTKRGRRFEKVMNKVMRLHSKVPEVWTYAAAWEFDNKLDVRAARHIMQKGLRICPKSEDLWVEYLRMELTYLNKLKARKVALGEEEGSLIVKELTAEEKEWREENKDLFMSIEDGNEGTRTGMNSDSEQPKKHDAFQEKALAILQTVYEGAINAIPSSIGLRQRFYEIVDVTNVAQSEDLKKQIVDDMRRDFARVPEFWEWLAKIELNASQTTLMESSEPVSKVLKLDRSIKVIDVLRGTKQKRHRDGYEDGDTILRKECSVADFVWSDKPLDILGSVTSMSFKDPSCETIKNPELTTEEVKFLCDDLRVLGKNDFKHLLKWRMHIRKALTPTPAVASPTPGAENEGEGAKDEDEKLLDELEELTNAMDRKKKREKRIIAKRRAKDKVRKATGIQIDAMQDGYTDNDLFSLASIKGKKDLIALDSAEFDAEKGDVVVSDDEGDEDEDDETDDSDLDSDEEHQRYDKQMEELLDQAYEQYMSKKGGASKQRKRAKQVYSEDAKLLEGGDDAEHQSDPDSDDDAGDHEANPLLAGLDEKEVPTQEQVTMQWFSQDIFAEAVKDGDLGVEVSDDEMEVDKQDKKVLAPKAEKIPVVKKSKKATPLQDAKPDRTKTQDPKSEMDFEIVPAPETDSSDSSESESELDNETKAEILAYGKKMLRKKQREQMMDDAYNKYLFHDDKNLPRWFVEEEKKHCQPIKPVTKEEVNAMKAQFKEIDARPAKKVAQAKARKKRVTERRLEKVRKKANTISDQTDISDRSKSKMIDQLYKKAEPKRAKKEYVVAKKGVQVKTGKGKVLVDRRMKKDMRQHGMKSKQGKGKKGKSPKGAKGAKGKGAPKGGAGANKGRRNKERA